MPLQFYHACFISDIKHARFKQAILATAKLLLGETDGQILHFVVESVLCSVYVQKVNRNGQKNEGNQIDAESALELKPLEQIL